MKIVMFADLHLERQFAWASPAAASRRRAGIRSTFTSIIELAEAEKADAIFCGGDLYEDEFFTPDLVSFVADTVDCGVPFLFSPGNHDHWSPTSLYARAALPATAHVFTEPEFTPVELAEGLRVFGTAHQANRGTPGFFDRRRPVVDRAGGDVALALFHGSERGGFQLEGSDKDPHAPFDATQVAEAGFDYAFVGHHHRGVVGPHHCYPGNPDPLEFGEDGTRGAVVAEIGPTGAVDITHHAVAHSSVHAVTVEVSGCEHGSDVLAAVRSAVAPLEGFVRVDLHGALDPDVELDRVQLDDAGRELDGFVVRTGAVHRRYPIEEILREGPSVRSRFIEMVRADADLSPEDQQLVIELGLRAFERRSDLEVV